MRGLWRALTSNGAATSPDAADPRLRGRTYAVPFDEVWRAALRLAGGGVPGWRVAEADDVEGVIRAVLRGGLRREERTAVIRIGFDGNAQTRVAIAVPEIRGAGPDFGAAARHIARFTAALDRELHRMRRGAGRPAPVRLDA